MSVTLGTVDAQFDRKPNLRGAKKTATVDSMEEKIPCSLGGYLRELHEFGTRRYFDSNETLFFEGDDTQRVYRIISGMLRLFRHAAGGARQITDFVLPGELIPFADAGAHSFTAEAVTPVTLTSYPRSQFEQYLKSTPAIAPFLLSNIATTHRYASVHACQPAKPRIAAFLVRFAERNDVRAGDRLEIPMPRLDIADHLGVTVDAVCRTIAALRDERIVVIPNSQELILKDIEALRTLAAGS
jgi:CRP-like cAMP-binding protein